MERKSKNEMLLLLLLILSVCPVLNCCEIFLHNLFQLKNINIQRFVLHNLATCQERKNKTSKLLIQHVETHEPKGEQRKRALGRSAAAVAAGLVDVASTGGTQIGIHSLFLHHVDGALARLGITHLLRSETLMGLGRDG